MGPRPSHTPTLHLLHRYDTSSSLVLTPLNRSFFPPSSIFLVCFPLRGLPVGSRARRGGHRLSRGAIKVEAGDLYLHSDHLLLLRRRRRDGGNGRPSGVMRGTGGGKNEGFTPNLPTLRSLVRFSVAHPSSPLFLFFHGIFSSFPNAPPLLSNLPCSFLFQQFKLSSVLLCLSFPLRPVGQQQL